MSACVDVLLSPIPQTQTLLMCIFPAVAFMIFSKTRKHKCAF